MKRKDLNNGQLQHWLQKVITHPAGVQVGMQTQAPIEKNPVLPSATLSAAERLHIYHSAYYSRLMACLRTEYPCLNSAIGAEVFDQFALAFLQNHPPSSFTLFDLSKHFPSYLQSIRPKDDDSNSLDQWPEFMIDLAILERANNEIYNGPGAEQLELMTPQDFLEIPPFELDQWQLKKVPPLHLLQFKFPVQKYFLEYHRGQIDPPIPAIKTTYLALNRLNYRVRFFELGEKEFAFLNELIKGQNFGAAITQLCDAHKIFRRELKREARGWIMRWTQQGFMLR